MDAKDGLLLIIVFVSFIAISRELTNRERMVFLEQQVEILKIENRAFKEGVLTNRRQ